MNRISFKGIFLALLVQCGGVIFMSLAIAILKPGGFEENLNILANSSNSMSFEVSMLALISIGGYLAARIAKRHEILNSVLTVIFEVINFLFVIVLGTIGGFSELTSEWYFHGESLGGFFFWTGLSVLIACLSGVYAREVNDKKAAGVEMDTDSFWIIATVIYFAGIFYGSEVILTKGYFGKESSLIKSLIYFVPTGVGVYWLRYWVKSFLKRKSIEVDKAESRTASPKNKTNTKIDSLSFNMPQTSCNESVPAETIEIQINRDGKIYGPYPVEVAREYLEQGSLSPDDSANISGMPSWERLDEVLKGIPA